jgi:hypothetical protein
MNHLPETSNPWYKAIMDHPGPQRNRFEDYEVPWEKSDLFFLRSAIEGGMSFARIAGFLDRTETEVREKSRASRLGGALRPAVREPALKPLPWLAD